MIEKKIVYFDKPGKENTAACLDIVKKAIEEYGYKHVVVASTGGDSGLLFSEALKDFGVNVVVVTHSYGFKEPNTTEMPDDIRQRITSLGARVITSTMPTHSIETALVAKLGGMSTTGIIAQSLRRFGEGIKVACEITMMAVDSGAVPESEEVISVAGTARGSDAVAVIRSSASKRFLDLKVLEILAKPRL